MQGLCLYIRTLFFFISDLTKIHIKDSQGNLVFTIRERPSTSYGHLGEEHHGNVRQPSTLFVPFLLVTQGKGDSIPLEFHHTSSLNYVPQPLEKLPGHPASENVLLSLQKNILCDSCSQISDWIIRNKTDECF